MQNKVTIESQGRNLTISFQERPSTKIRNNLWEFSYRTVDPFDTVWEMQDFEMNHQMVFASIEYLQEIGYNVETSVILTKQFNNIVKKQDIDTIIEKGNEIKSMVIDDVAVPNFKRTLMPYQRMPVKHIQGLHSVANFSVPGSGKTTIVLAGYSFLKTEGIVNKLLVIGPYSSLMPWEEEILACFNSVPPKTRIHGSKKERYKVYFKYEKYEIFLTTFHTAYSDIEYLIDLVQKDDFMIVLDESHNIKNINGKISSTILRLSTFSSTKVILTGTPIPNSIEDIFTQITFLYPESLIGSTAKFKHLVKSHRNPKSFIKEKIFPIFTRITKNQMGLKPPRSEEILVPMSKIQEKLYILVSERINNIIEAEAGYVSLDTINEYKRCKFIRLRQIASNVNLLLYKGWEYNVESLQKEIAGKSDPITNNQILDTINNLNLYSKNESSPKLLKAFKLVQELKNKGVKKIIVWSDFIINCETLYNLFKLEYGDNNVFLIIGDTPKSKASDIKAGIYTPESREDQISIFKRNPKEFSILIANPMACAESISLHKVCHDAIYVDRSFNCGLFMQSKDRIHRVGLDPNVDTTYYYLMATSENLKRVSIDEKIHRRLYEKEKYMLEVLNDNTTFEGANDPEQEDIEEIFDEI